MSLIKFVLNYTPDTWENPPCYDTSYVLIEVKEYTSEHRNISAFFSLPIKKIKRVQNPFQYGRFMLRKEKLNNYIEEDVFHAVHKDDLNSALIHNCDYRRYTKRYENINCTNKHPYFYSSTKRLLRKIGYYSTRSIRVLILSKISCEVNSQCNYYIKYIVELDKA